MVKVAVVTGTSSGVGLELSLLLAKNGYNVYATMRNLDKQSNLKSRAIAENLNLNICALDVTNDVSIKECFTKIITEAGKIDLLINNAGAGFIRSTEQANLDEIEWVTQTNYMSVVKCTKAVIGQMRSQKSGHIVNIGSVGGLVGQPFNELYCAAKFAVEGYTEALASYITQAFNINFTVIEPGGISSDFAQTVRQSMEQGGGVYDDEYQSILQQYFNSRSNYPDDVFQTPLEVAEVIYSKAINVANPPIRLRTSKWAEEFTHLKTITDPDGYKLKKQVEQMFLNINHQ